MTSSSFRSSPVGAHNRNLNRDRENLCRSNSARTCSSWTREMLSETCSSSSSISSSDSSDGSSYNSTDSMLMSRSCSVPASAVAASFSFHGDEWNFIL